MKDGDKLKPRPLSGIKVLEFSQLFAGPFCCRQMCDMGAEIIKLEPPPDGELIRRVPYLAGRGFSGSYVKESCGKKSICIDVRFPEGLEMVRKLAAQCDVIVQNFRPGVMERMGLGYNSLRELNPSLIMCSISGYGQDGPYAQRPSGEQVIQAYAGVVWMTGDPEGPPYLPGWSYADSSTGLFALSAILAALLYRERTGLGQHIDLALADCVFAQNDLSYMASILSHGKEKPVRYGRYYPNIVPLGVYEGKDGYVVIVALSQSAFERLASTMGKPEIAIDPRFDDADHRRENKDELYRIISDWVKSMESTAEVERVLNANSVMCSRVNTIEDILKDPNVKARQMLVEVDHPYLGKIEVPNTPLRFSEMEASLRGRPPFFGEHNEEVLTSLLGYKRKDVAQLLVQGVLYADDEIAGELYEEL